MLTHDAIEAIERAGIKPPPFGFRTTCPECSPFRRKRHERCMLIKEYDWGVEWFCHHCHHVDGVRYDQ